jgi:hypothetical protein
MNLTLPRFSYGRDATLGTLYVATLRLATLEEPWAADPEGPGGQRREGGLRESCVPDGTYELRPHTSAKYPDGVWALVNPVLGVYAPGTRPAGQKWGRDAILIHSGNTTDNIEGCILVGHRHGELDGMPAVLDSRNALTALRAALGTGSHTLQIRPTAGTSEIAA